MSMNTKTELVVYGAAWCSYCVALQGKLDGRGVSYKYKNVDEPGVREEMNKKTDGNQTIPVLLKGSSFWVNPDEKALKEAQV